MKNLPIPVTDYSLMVEIEKDWMPRDKHGEYAAPFGPLKPKANVILRMPCARVTNGLFPGPPYVGEVGKVDVPRLIPQGDPSEDFAAWYEYLANVYGRLANQLNHTIALIMDGYLLFVLVECLKRSEATKLVENSAPFWFLSPEKRNEILAKAYPLLAGALALEQVDRNKLAAQYKTTLEFGNLKKRLEENFSNLAIFMGQDPLNIVWPPPYGYVSYNLALNGMVGKITFNCDILSGRELAVGEKELYIDNHANGIKTTLSNDGDWPPDEVFGQTKEYEQVTQDRIPDPTRPGSYCSYGFITGFMFELRRFDPDPSSSSLFDAPPPPPIP